MALTKCKLGTYIELRGETNTDLKFGLDDVRGVNNLKKLMATKADLNGRDLSKFQIVYPGEFVFSGMQTGRDKCIRISVYLEETPVIVSPAYVTFEIEATDIIIPAYFFSVSF